jgi:hypothetical protein
MTAITKPNPGATAIVPTTPPSPPPSPSPSAAGEAAWVPPPTFETSLENMLASFGGNREPSLPLLIGAALLRLGNIDNSLATISGAASGSSSSSSSGAAGGSSSNGLAVKVALDQQLQKAVDTLTKAVSTDERDLASTKQQLAETEKRMVRLEEHLGHLRARYETLVSGTAEMTERVAVVQKDHGRFIEELAAFSQRIEPLEHRKKTG